MAQVDLPLPDANEGRLPKVCIYCGAHAVTRRRKTLVGTTPFTFFMGAGRKGVLRIPVCERHRGKTIRVHAVEAAAFVLMFAALGLCGAIAKAAPDEFLGTLKPHLNYFGGAAVATLVGAFVARIYAHYSDIHCLHLSDHSALVAGVSPRFVDALDGEVEEDDEVLPARRVERRSRPGDVLTVEPIDEEDEVEEVEPAERPRTRKAARRAEPKRSGGRGLLLALVLLGAFALCGGGAAGVVWLVMRSSTEVVLTNGRVQPMGLVMRVVVDYRIPGTPDPQADYILVVRTPDGRTGEVPVPGATLGRSGTMERVVAFAPRGGFGPPQPGGGVVTIQLERAAGPGGPRKAVSNEVSVSVGFLP